MLWKTRCERDIHKFKPRYDEHPNVELYKRKFSVTDANPSNVLYYRTYVLDVCIRCGKVIRR